MKAHRIGRAVGLAAFGVACGVGFGVVTDVARDRAAESQDLTTSASALELIEIQSTVRRTAGAETNEMMLDLLGPGSPDRVLAARAARVGAQQSAIASLRELAGDDSVVGREAQRMLDALPPQLADDEAIDPILLWDTFLSTWSVDLAEVAELDGTDDRIDRWFELARLDSVGTMLLNDTLDAEFAWRSPDVPPLMSGYTSRSEPYVRSNAGWLGPDPEQPLLDGWVVSPEFLESTTGRSTIDDAADEIQRAVAASDLWLQEDWVRSWAELDDPGPPPLPLASVDRLAADLDSSSRSTVDALLAAEQDRIAAAATDRERASELLTGIAGILGVLAVAALGTAAGTGIASGRRTRRKLSSDPLTNVGNRHQLDDRAAQLVADPSLGWHLVVMIDMNRFKMVNDTWGHQTGDRLLVATAQRLSAVADEWIAASRSNQATVIRIGGDEFVVTLHAREAHDPDESLARLRAIRSTTIESETGAPIALSFSIGHAVGHGPSDLDTLLRIADLASYEDKRTESLDRPDRRQPGHEPRSPDRSEPKIVHTPATTTERSRSTEVIHREA